MNTGLWTQFLNSDRKDYLGTGAHRDELDNPEWLLHYLSRWGLEIPAGSRDALTRSLRRLRTALQEAAEKIIAEQRVRAVHLEPLNAILAGAPLIRRLDVSRQGVGVRLQPVSRTAAALMAEIVSSFADTLSRGEVSRMKICGNADCRWFFYDESRNKTRRWCEPTCGNLMKVRRFRAKRALQRGAAPRATPRTKPVPISPSGNYTP